MERLFEHFVGKLIVKQVVFMKKNVLIIIVLLFSLIRTSFGQQEKLVTHFIFDKMSINPGSTGHVISRVRLVFRFTTMQ